MTPIDDFRKLKKEVSRMPTNQAIKEIYDFLGKYSTTEKLVDINLKIQIRFDEIQGWIDQ